MRRAAAAGALLLCVLVLCFAQERVLSRALGPICALAEDCLAAPDPETAGRALEALSARWERFSPLAAGIAGRAKADEVRLAIAALSARIRTGASPADPAAEAAALRERLGQLR